MPNIRHPVNIPLALTANKPPKVVIRGSGWVPVDPTILHLREVAFKEVDLVLIIWVWWVCSTLLHREVVVQPSSPQVCSGLGDQLRPPHVRIPQGSGVDGDLDSLPGDIVCWVLV